MQKMTEGEGDTHDHGPPKTNAMAQETQRVLRQHTPYPKLAVWSTTLSSASVNSFSGALAGVASGIVTCPLDVIKTKLQAGKMFYNPGLRHPGPQAGQLYHGMIGTAKTIFHREGVLGFYRGLGPMLLGYLPTWAVYMAVYDGSREYFYNHGFGDRPADKWFARVYASITAGACSTLATNPIWVIKTRLMSQVSPSASDGARTPWNYTSTIDAARKMYHAEGLRAFYSGLTPAMLGLTHVAIQFPLYEYFKQQFTGLEMGQSPASSGSEAQNTLGILAATFLSKVCATTATYPHEVLRTRLQTQQRHLHPESTSNGVSGHHHSQAIPRNRGKRIGNTDGSAYQPRYHGVIKSCRIILREEGWRAFYNGLGTNMVRAVPAAMTTMLTYESIKGAIGRLQEEGRTIEKERGL
jgi:solute carrier family 25 (mitochondrial folate transporter), member 32